ncbi:MAG: OmpH family outer membrane protein [Bdellovibrionales bacterium]|nr:OmpH family outer membrane protein [Bdellovibrionales bacterium]
MVKSLGILLVTAMFASPAFAEAKFGYVDMQKALQSTKAGKQAKASLEKEFNKKKKELEKLEADIKKMKEDIEKKSLVMSDEMKAKKQAEFQREFIKYQQQMAKSQQEISMKEREVTLPILQKLKKTIDTIAEKEKYDMIFEKSEQSVLFAKSGLDLTDKVVQEYEKSK